MSFIYQGLSRHIKDFVYSITALWCPLTFPTLPAWCSFTSTSFCTFTAFFVLYPTLRICLTSSSWFVDHMFICLTFQLNTRISALYLLMWIFTWFLLMLRMWIHITFHSLNTLWESNPKMSTTSLVLLGHYLALHDLGSSCITFQIQFFNHESQNP